jgi:hypothetical protein
VVGFVDGAVFEPICYGAEGIVSFHLKPESVAEESHLISLELVEGVMLTCLKNIKEDERILFWI